MNRVYVGVSHVTKERDGFAKEVSKRIEKFQKAKLFVEVQYSFSNGVSSALILGYTEEEM